MPFLGGSMVEQFNPIQFVPGFYHKWPFKLHIEFDEMYKQVDQMIQQIFYDEDELLVVVNTYPMNPYRTVNPRFIKRFLKNSKLKYQLTTNAGQFEFDGERFPIVQFRLKCKMNDLYLKKLLYTCCHVDMLDYPRFKKKDAHFPPEVYVYNITKGVVVHIYDDRGCELMFQHDKEQKDL